MRALGFPCPKTSSRAAWLTWKSKPRDGRNATQAEFPIAWTYMYSLKCNRMLASVVGKNPVQSELATVRNFTSEANQCASRPRLDQATDKSMTRLHVGSLVALAMPRMQLRTPLIGRRCICSWNSIVVVHNQFGAEGISSGLHSRGEPNQLRHAGTGHSLDFFLEDIKIHWKLLRRCPP